jgi:hypothetical protein
MLQHVSIGAAILMGLAALANGTFMLVAPEHWYVLVPGVTTTGPFNQHFIRDIGLIFLFVGAAFLLGAAKSEYRVGSGRRLRCGWRAMLSSIFGRSLRASARRRRCCVIFPP